ncbi:hypothetical protein DYB37_009189 [Aphanomyces astaci]|uniref:Uncharacterized protein n=1 Tax=Aphanomyces astaci TaxID=112090 RepID=A0A3R6XX80_APHAT|nr:hypothetical protein DYB35_005879 [Aphanomyces astaci]RHZ14677.1 hypothetical protein DYB37_009189 [Aphanomyces astaci]
MKDISQRQKVRSARKGRSKKGAEIFHERRNDSVQQTRDKKKQARKRLRMVQIQRHVDKKLDHLRAYPVDVVHVVKRPKGPLKPEEWKLRGAARPAALLARIANGECDVDGNEFKAPDPTKDFYEEMRGRFAEHNDTLEYLRLRKDLALATCAAGMMEAGIAHFEECIELDPTDAACARDGLVCALIDEGRADEARGLIDRYENVSPVLEYCRTIIEYVSWEVLEEDGSSEDVVQAAFTKAWDGNPFIGVFIAGLDAFNAVVEYVEDIKNPPKVDSSQHHDSEANWQPVFQAGCHFWQNAVTGECVADESMGCSPCPFHQPEVACEWNAADDEPDGDLAPFPPSFQFLDAAAARTNSQILMVMVAITLSWLLFDDVAKAAKNKHINKSVHHVVMRKSER